MHQYRLIPRMNLTKTSYFPFELAANGSPKSVEEARDFQDRATLAAYLDKKLDRHEGSLGRICRFDQQREDLNKDEGEVAVTNFRSGRSTYDAYLAYSRETPGSVPMHKAELVRNGKTLLEVESKPPENSKVEVRLTDFQSEKMYLISGTIGGSAEVTTRPISQVE